MKLNKALINTLIIAAITLVILLNVYSEVVPTAQSAGDELNASSYCDSLGCIYNGTLALCTNGSTYPCEATKYVSQIPLGSLFNGSGVVFLIIMAALVIMIVRSYLKKK